MISLDRDWQRPAPTATQLRTDVAIAVLAALLGGASVEIWRSAYGADPGWQGVEAYAYFVVAGLALAGRRRYPLSVLAFQTVLFILIGERFTSMVGIFTLQMAYFASLYAAWAWSRRPRALLALTTVVVVAMFVWLVVIFTRPEMYPDTASGGVLSAAAALIVYSLVVNVVYFAGAIAWGQSAWQSARRRCLVDEQHQRERELREGERQRAVQAERVRIARDLHDVVAHHVSSIGIQASGAARSIDTKPETARRALATIESSSRQAVTQMHQLVGLLRDADDAFPDDRGPQPGMDDLARLADPGGSPVVVHRQVGEAFEVPGTVALSLFRVAQEAIANARRHGAARTVTVTTRFLARDADAEPAVEVEIIDDGRGAGPGADDSGGFGLRGIRERAAMHDGEAEIGPRPAGGFRVRVRVPVSAS